MSKIPTQIFTRIFLATLLFSLTTQTSFAQSVSPNYQLYNSYTSLGVTSQNSANFDSTSGVVVTPGRFVSPNFSAISDSIKPVQSETPEPPNPPSPAQSAGSSGSTTSITFTNLRKVVTPTSASVSFSTDRLARTYISYYKENTSPVTTPMTLNAGQNHTFLIENLSANTVYYFKLHALDASNRLSISPEFSLITSSMLPFEPTNPEVEPDEPSKEPSNVVRSQVLTGFPEIIVTIPGLSETSEQPQPTQDQLFDLQLNFGFSELSQTILDKFKGFVGLSQAPKLTFYADSWTIISINQTAFRELPDRITFELDGRKYIMRKNDQNNTYQAKIKSPENPGSYTLNLKVEYIDEAENSYEHPVKVVSKSQVVRKDYYDFDFKNPFKFLFKKTTPIEDAKLEFFVLNQNSKWELWEANFYAQNNPIFTDENGHFTVQLPTSQFTIRVTKGKNLTHQTEPFKTTEKLLSKTIVVNPSFNYRLAIFALVLFGIFIGFVLKSVRKK